MPKGVVSQGSVTGGNAAEVAEGARSAATAVEAEDEFAQVGSDMAAAQAVINESGHITVGYTRVWLP